VNGLDRFSKFFLITLGCLTALGVIMVYSSSYIFAKEVYGNSGHFFLRQLLFVFLGFGLAYAVSRTKLNFWLKFAFHLHLFFSVLLILTFIPGIGLTVKGASRWINLGIINFQPGEFIKYSLIMTSLIFFENFTRMETKERVKYGLSIVIPMLLLLKQPDFGAFTICFLVIGFVCFMSSLPRKYFWMLISGGTVVSLIFLVTKAYRIKRLMAFLDPWKNPKTTGFQIIQSYLGFANGSFFGQGLGNGNEKLFYLPEAHNDFILSVIGEEMGFLGVTLIVILFVLLIYFGFKLALQIKNRLGLIFVSTIVFTIGLQAFINMGVVLGLLPTKGLNLPFVSYGGSSLLSNFFAIGLMFSAYRESSFSVAAATQSFTNRSNFENRFNDLPAAGANTNNLPSRLPK
jgi:cell division protein FtsW